MNVRHIPACCGLPLIVLLLPHDLTAQVLFSKAWYVPGDTSSVPSMNQALCETSDHDIHLIAGVRLESGPDAPIDFLLAQRTNLDGDVTWRRKYFSSGAEGFTVSGTVGMPDGSVVTHGQGLSDDFAQRAFLLRTDQNGSPIAAKWYAQELSETRLECARVVNDSTLLLVGKTTVDGLDAAWWAFADGDGELDTVHYVQTMADTHCGFDHIAPCAGGYLLNGPSVSGNLNGLIVARIDNTGALLWAHKLEEATPSNLLEARGAFAPAMGGFRVFGDSRPEGSLHHDVVMISLNAAGGLSWQQRITFTTFADGFPTTNVLEAGTNLYWLSGGAGSMGRCSAVIDAVGLVNSAWHTAPEPGNQDAIAAIRASDTTLVTLSSWQHPSGVAGDLVPKLTKDRVVPMSCSPAALSRNADLGDFTLYTTWTTGTLTFTTTDLLPELSTQLDAVDELAMCISTAVAVEREAPALTVAPVPTTGPLTLHGTAVTAVDVLDAHGRPVHSRTFAASPIVVLDLTHLAPGMYHVRIHEDGQWIGRRLVKE